MIRNFLNYERGNRAVNTARLEAESQCQQLSVSAHERFDIVPVWVKNYFWKNRVNTLDGREKYPGDRLAGA